MMILAGYTGVWAYIRLILVLVFVLVLAYYGARFAGNYQNNILNNKSNIKIVESYRIGGNKLIAIAKIGKDYYAIGVGKDEFTLIDKLDGEYIEERLQSRQETSSEKKSFKEVLVALTNKTDKQDK